MKSIKLYNLKKFLAICILFTIAITTVHVNAADTTYKSHITLYVGDGNPTGTKMKVGDHYSQNWYVTEINTSYVKFGSQYYGNGNTFIIPAPEEIWTGVTSNYQTMLTYSSFFNEDTANVGKQVQVIYTGGSATYKNVINTGDNGPYVTVIHKYYTNGILDGTYSENVQVSGYYAYASNYYKTTYNGIIYPTKSYDNYLIRINGNGYQGTFNLTYNRTLAIEMVTLTYDANGGVNPPSATTVEKGTSVTIKNKDSMYKEGYIFLGWNTNKDATVADWAPEDTMRLNENFTLYAVWKKIGYTIEYYYDNVRDDSRREIRDTRVSNTELKQKIEANVKENYTFKKVEDCTSSYNVIKIYYIYENAETPIEPDYPTDPETGKRLYTITIENDKSGHTYNSYQVFQGDYYEKEEDGKKIPLLSNIEWGPELQKEAEEGKTHGDKIVEALKLQNEETYKDCKTAADVAYALEGKENDGDIIREFTNIVGKYLLDNNITLTKGTNTLIQEKDINGNVVKSNYKIDKLEPGYYIVIDAETNEKDDAYSRYLIDVVQDVTMEPKSSIPTIHKKVIGNNIKNQVEGTGTSEDNPAQYVEDEKRNTAIYKENGEYDIGFELKSYIPETDSYSNYKFEIVDILAKGFDVDTSSIQVMLENNEYAKTRVNKAGETVNNYIVNTEVISAENYNTYKNYFEEEGKTYPEGYAESNYGKTLILVELEDLVGQASEGFVTKGQDVFVKYNSKLNGKCEVGNMPNINEAYLKYSNNPYNKESTTQTTTEVTYTYTIDLNLSKIAEIKKTDNNNENTAEGTESVEPELKYLSGAEFEIYDGPEYIKEEGSLLPSKNPNRKLIATITTSKEEKDEEGNVIVQAGYADYSGLAAGTYYIKETKSPDGYNKLKEEIEIEIKAECDEYGAIIWKVEDKTKDNLVLVQMGVKNETSIPEIKLQVQNTSGYQLPITGGTGTIIFTLTGLGIMALAVVCLKNNKKK